MSEVVFGKEEAFAEVALVATADLAYWRGALAGTALSPHDVGGRAELLLSATEGRLFGIPAREFTASLFVRDGEAGGETCLLRFAAARSSRAAGAAERLFAGAPFVSADVAIGFGPEPHFALSYGAEDVLRARRSAQVPPGLHRPEFSETVVLLTDGGPLPRPDGRRLKLRVAGRTEARVFEPTTDLLSHRLSDRFPSFAPLMEGRTVGKEWRVRHEVARARTRIFAD